MSDFHLGPYTEETIKLKREYEGLIVNKEQLGYIVDPDENVEKRLSEINTRMREIEKKLPSVLR